MRRLTSLLASLSTIFLVALCLGVLVLGWYALSLPDRAAAVFGPPAPGLSKFQLYYLSAMLLMHEDDLTKPPVLLTGNAATVPHGTTIQQPDSQKLSFEIQPGETTASITDRLQQAGLISDAQTMRNYLVYAGLDTTIQAGKYQLSPGTTALDIARNLQKSSPGEVAFHILAGWRVEEIAASLPTSGLNISPEAFLNAVYQPSLPTGLANELPASASLEGFLFPDAYQLNRSLTLDQFLTILLDRFLVIVDSELRQGFQRQGLNLYQAVTLASIIQREAMLEEEMPTIASVFYNRLAAGMKLDSDPTVQYALAKPGYDAQNKTWWKNPLSVEDLKVASPYNTYQNTELPPGPIANPGLSALKAVAFPAQTPYYYFRAACDGSGRHAFSKTFQEHLSKNCP